MATGPASQGDIVPDAVPYLDTANDQPAVTSASNRSQRERSEGHHFGPENETDSQRNGDLANSQDQQITDKEVSDYFPLLPPELKEGVIHILIINADEDKKMAKQLKTELQTKVKLSNKGSIKTELNVKLFNEVMGNTIEQTNNAYEMSVFIFLLVTDSFVKDDNLVWKSHSYLNESLKSNPKKWCVIPIVTAPKMKDKLPVELKLGRGFNYWQGNEMDFFEDINNILNHHFGSILHCERQLAEKTKRYCRENRERLKKDFEHFKSSSYPSLCENTSGSTHASCEQNLPQYPQQMEPMLENRSSQGLPPHAYSCPANLSQVSGNRQPITEHVAQTAICNTTQTSSSPHTQSEVQHPHLPRSGVTASNTASSAAEQLHANRGTDISTDGATHIDEPGGNSGTDAINVNLVSEGFNSSQRQARVQGLHSPPNQNIDFSSITVDGPASVDDPSTSPKNFYPTTTPAHHHVAPQSGPPGATQMGAGPSGQMGTPGNTQNTGFGVSPNAVINHGGRPYTLPQSGQYVESLPPPYSSRQPNLSQSNPQQPPESLPPPYSSHQPNLSQSNPQQPNFHPLQSQLPFHPPPTVPYYVPMFPNHYPYMPAPPSIHNYFPPQSFHSTQPPFSHNTSTEVNLPNSIGSQGPNSSQSNSHNFSVPPSEFTPINTHSTQGPFMNQGAGGPFTNQGAGGPFTNQGAGGPFTNQGASDNDSGCLEVIPTAAADEAEAEISEPASRDSIGILISRRRVEPEEDNSEDQDELHQISSLKF